MSRSTSFSVLPLSGLVAIAASLGLAVACAGTDVPLRDENGIGGSATASAGAAGSGGASGGSSGAGGAGSGGSGTAGTDDEPDPDTGGSSGSAGTGGGSDCDATVLVSNCGGGGCHGTGSGFSAFAADTAAPATFVDRAPAISGAACGSIIDGGDSTESLIYKKVTGTQGSCGGPMPPSGPLAADVVTCVEDFLTTLEE